MSDFSKKIYPSVFSPTSPLDSLSYSFPPSSFSFSITASFTAFVPFFSDSDNMIQSELVGVKSVLLGGLMCEE